MKQQSLSMDDLIARVKNHPRIREAGMLLCHNGIVREFDRSGEKRVKALKVQVNRAKVEEIRLWAESLPGIVAVAIEALEGEFQVGDDLLYIVVAGDIRENVFHATRQVLERTKAEAVKKNELYLE